MAKGCSPALDRMDAYKAKIRVYGGTGSPSDYSPAVVQQKIALMYRKVQKALGD